jgi:hypothetical protein
MSIHDWPKRYLELHAPAIREMNLKLGYRFELREAAWPDAVELGKEFVISSRWVNVGVARRYAGATLAWTLLTPDGRIAWTCVDDSRDFKDAKPKLKGVEHPFELESRVRFGYVAAIPQMNDGVWEHEVKDDPKLSGNVPTIAKGVYSLAVSLGDADGTPRIALPLVGGRDDRRYVLGKIEIR